MFFIHWVIGLKALNIEGFWGVNKIESNLKLDHLSLFYTQQLGFLKIQEKIYVVYSHFHILFLLKYCLQL